MLPRLEHANLTVRNLEASLEFLQAAFPEWQIRHTGESDRKWAHFGDDAHYLALEEARDEGELQSGKYLSTGFNHLGFVVSDLEAVSTRLLAAGYLEGKATEDHSFRRRRYFYDRDKFEWEFIEYLSKNREQYNQYPS